MTNVIDLLTAALDDRYQIEREIGRGGMATVFLARDLKHDRQVALKVLDPELGAVLGAERFLSEIRVTANLQHPNLLPLFDSGEAGGLLFYVMPYVSGESLRNRLERERQLPINEAVHIAIAIAGALDYAHRHGVIHRDLKPENVLLNEGQPLVADFGIALAVSNAGGQRVTQTGLSLGTPQYMSPEQATGDRVIDGRTDIYSLAALLYEMIAGEAPHSGNTAQAVIAKLMTERPRPLSILRPTVPAYVENAVQRALEKLPADRYPVARDFAFALDASQNPTGTTNARGVIPARRSRITAALFLLPWLIVASLAAFLVRGRERDEPALQLARQLTFDGTVTGAAISPDGAWLAYVTDDCSGATQSCGFTLQTREVDGTQSVSIAHWRKIDQRLAWSPDGSIVLFRGAEDTSRTVWHVTNRLGGSIRRVPLNAEAATFTPEGKLALVAGPTGRQTLYRLDPVALTVTDSLTLPARFNVLGLAYRKRAPEIALNINDGSEDQSGSTLALMTEDGKITDTISFPGRSWIKWNAAENAIMVMTFGPGLSDDLRALHVNGTKWVRGVVPVVLGQVQSGFDGCFDVARNGRTVIVFHQTVMELQVGAITDGGNAWRSITRRTGYLDARAISPDGKLVAVDATDNIGDNIYVFPLDGGGPPRAITASRGVREGPVWSRDGKRLAYMRSTDMLSVSDQTKLPPSGLVITDITGGRETTIRPHMVNVTGYAWLSQSLLVLATGASQFQIVDTAGVIRDSIQVPDSVGKPTWLAVDQAGRRLAFWSQRRRALVIFDLKNRVILRVLPSEIELGTPVFTDDGSLIIGEGRSGTSNIMRYSSQLLRIPPDLSSAQHLLTLPPLCSRPVVTPDGRRVVCGISRAKPDVWLADVAGKSGW